MDNAGDWLYIVFLVVAAISGLFNSKNKKKNRPDILGQPDKEIVTNDQPASGKGFWEILQEMESPRPEPEPEPQPQPQAPKVPQKKKLERSKAFPTPTPFLSSEKNIPDRIAETSPIMAPVEEESGILSDISFRDLDELKKGVVYAEILNRKYS